MKKREREPLTKQFLEELNEIVPVTTKLDLPDEAGIVGVKEE